MKKALILFLAILIIPISGSSQEIENLDYISPFHEDLAAIKKEGQWEFINTIGEIIIDFRDDLVVTSVGDINYPIFSEDRCLIEEQKDDISYFGYIDTSGKTVIEPQFLNAANFNEERALALKLIKDVVAKNEALEKNVVYYKYHEVVIDKNGEAKNYLNPKGVNVVLDKDFLKEPPQITAKQISKTLYAFKGKHTKWTLIRIND